MPDASKEELFVEVADRFPYFALWAITQMECTADEPAEVQPFTGSWTVGELLCSEVVQRWMERHRLNELAGMIREFPKKGFRNAAVLRELAKVPNPWPNYPYRSLGKPERGTALTRPKDTARQLVLNCKGLR